jgi:tripartite-type tricarboxylate transporter receptor subunit TctC
VEGNFVNNFFSGSSDFMRRSPTGGGEMRDDARKILGIGFAVVLLLTTTVIGVSVAEEKFPTQPVTLIISWSPGGGQDLTARALQPLVEKALGESVVVVNKPGGGASIGFNYVADSKPNAYTILQASPSISILKYTMRAGVDYKRYEPIIFGAYTPAAVLVKADAPWNNLKEFLDYAKANPGKLRVGNSGHGAIWHISALAIEHAAGVQITHVPFKGTSPSIPSILGGHIEAILAGFGDTMHLVKGGKLKYLGIAAPERSKFAPELQTCKELGMDVEMISYYSWLAPKGTPTERVKILHDAFRKALESKTFKEYTEKQGITIAIKGSEEFANFLDKEDKKFRELITIAGIKPKG